MFVTNKRYNEMKEYYEKRIEEYIYKLSRVEAEADTLRDAIIHAVCYLYNPETLDVETALKRLETGYNIAKNNDRRYKLKLMDNFRKSKL